MMTKEERRAYRNAAARARHAANPEKMRELQRKWCAANPEKRKEYRRRSENSARGRETKRQWVAAHPEQRREIRRRYVAANHGKIEAARRRRMLNKYYGITPEGYDAMLKAQGGGCAICGRKPGAKRLAVDHCHATGAVRGLLCSSCNTTIGKHSDSPEMLRAMLRYIERFSQLRLVG